MRFLRLPLLGLLLLISLALPVAASAQGTNTIFDPIIPAECKCASVPVVSADGLTQTGAMSPSAPGWGCVLTVVQNVINTAVALAVIVVVLAIVYAGFMLMTSGSKPDARTKARHLLANTLIGLLVLLGAWLLIDFVMKFVYNPDAVVSGETRLGPWHGIGASNGRDMCIVVREQTPIASGVVGLIKDVINGPQPWSSTAPGRVGAGLCSPESVLAAAAAGGYQLTQAQANTLSCLAVPESSCGRNISGAKTPGGAPTTAYGMFQIVMGYPDDCHSLNIPICTAAAQRVGWKGGELNCSRAFSGGRVKQGMEELARVCRAAAANLECNVSAAACLVKRSPSFSDWTSDPRSSAQRACINKYSGG